MLDIASALSVLVAATFVVAAATKLRSLDGFRSELADYQLLPSWSTMPIAVVIPCVEVAAAIFALLPATRPVGALGLFVLLMIFCVAIAVNLHRGRREISCACFGAKSRTLSWVLLFRNGLLALPLLVTAILAAAPEPFLTLAGAIGAAVGAVLALLALEMAKLVDDQSHRAVAS